MRRTFALFSLLAATLFFACNDSGTGDDLSQVTPLNVCHQLRDCCNTIKTEATKKQCEDQAASLEKNASSNPDATRQACENAAQGYTTAKICGPDAIDPNQNTGGTAGTGGAGTAGAGTAGAETAGGGIGGQGNGGLGGTTDTPETTNELCSDGKDNDNNGFADCDDYNCTTSPNVTVCNPNTGGDPFGGGNSEDTKELCSDGVDNDGDGYKDCEDKGCCDLVDCKKTAPNSYCGKGGGTGGTSSAENTAKLCSDSKDNDGDGYKDCEDKDCCDLVDCKKTAPNSYCGKGGGTGGTSGAENTAKLCSDGKDNDGNGYKDCEDKGCCDLVDCKKTAPNSYCGKGGGTGGGSGENTVELCSDGKDNDGNNFVDCEDKGCCKIIDCKATAPNSYCGKMVPENTKELCSDGKDNDGDSYKDCEDKDCCSVVDCKKTAPNSYCGKQP